MLLIGNGCNKYALLIIIDFRRRATTMMTESFLLDRVDGVLSLSVCLLVLLLFLHTFRASLFFVAASYVHMCMSTSM